MPLQNRVTPLGELIADAGRGLVYGNRGCLHDGAGRIRRRYDGKRWIGCQLQFRGWRRQPLLRPGGFTELFFLDEATALAAGHRPCALCRREDYGRLVEVWHELHPGQLGADAIDAQLHRERVIRATRTQRQGAPWLVLGAALLSWTPAGYLTRIPRPASERARLVTPPSLIAIMRAGWQPLVPLIHPSAFASAAQRSGPRSVS